MAYRITAIPMTLSELEGHLQGHSLTSSFFNCYFSYCCAAVDMISTDRVRRAVRRR